MKISNILSLFFSFKKKKQTNNSYQASIKNQPRTIPLKIKIYSYRNNHNTDSNTTLS